MLVDGHFGLLSITTVDAINIQNPFELSVRGCLLVGLIEHAIYRRAVNVIIDWIPRLFHIKFIAFVVVRVLRVLATVIIPALL